MGSKTCSLKSNMSTTGNSWAHHWEPRSKTVVSIVFVTGIISLQTVQLLGLVFITVFFASLSTGMHFKTLIKRMLWVAPFLLLMAVPLVFGGGIPPSEERATFASLIIIKALISIAVMTILLGTQTVQVYFNGLANMRLPAVIVAVLFLSYRYIFLFVNHVMATRRAFYSRNFQPSLKKRSLTVYGEMAGGLLLKAIDRSETVHRAMTARCFTGKLHVGQPLPVTAKDIYKCVLVFMLTLAVIMAEWRWPG